MTVVKCDKHPANYWAIFENCDYGFLYEIGVGCLRLTRVVRLVLLGGLVCI